MGNKIGASLSIVIVEEMINHLPLTTVVSDGLCTIEEIRMAADCKAFQLSSLPGA